MKQSVGQIAMLTIDGKVAGKDKSGKLTGGWVSFKAGDVGAVIEERGSNWRDKSFLLSLAGGVVLLRANAVVFPDEDDIRVSAEALVLSDPDYSIREGDHDEGAEY